ncbi:MAG: aspartate aminotransferase family protein [Acidimicrobiia bacterium]
MSIPALPLSPSPRHLAPVADTLDGIASNAWLRRDEAALAGVLRRVSDVVALRGEGSWLVDVDGRRFLDFTSGIATASTGHCHPRVVRAICEQAATLLHTSVVTHQTRSVELAEKLGRLTPFLADPQVFFCNSGAEAVDGALKLARLTTGRPGVIAFRRAFHGRTLAATTLTTAKARYREGYEPLLGSVYHAPYCVASEHSSPEQAVRTALAGLDEILTLQAPPATVGAIIVEPVLGEGGYVVPPVEWLVGLRQRCDEHGLLLIFDEVQTGIGRTGHPFAAIAFGVAPDVILFAKGIASGMPLGGIIAGRELMDRWPPGAHGSTFGGNPVSCAAAVATLEVLEEEGCYERVRCLGEHAVRYLQNLARDCATVVSVRGIGFMIGIELRSGREAAIVQERCLERGLLVLTCGPQENVLRLVPALTLEATELEAGLAIVAAALMEG